MTRVCVVTVSRADYGLLRWVMRAITESPTLSLQLVVTGAHFSSDQGNTVDEILNDGFTIDAHFPMAPDHTTPEDITSALGRGLTEMGSALSTLKPNVVVLLGDRAETIVAALAATIAGIPIAHIHGGEVTHGAIDDAFRHSITKMSHLHFVVNEEYRHRVIQLGEDPSRVFVVGALGHESVQRMGRLSRSELEEKIGVSFGPRNILVTLHPETLSPANNPPLLEAVKEAVTSLEETHVFVTAANVDQGGEEFNRAWRRLSETMPNVWFFESLGTHLYLSLLAQVDAVVGNSSSGIFEAPALGIPTINIGLRQEGRVMAKTIQQVPAQATDIVNAIENAGAWRVEPERPSRSGERAGPIYTSHLMIAELEKHSPSNLLRKGFVDLP